MCEHRCKDIKLENSNSHGCGDVELENRNEVLISHKPTYLFIYI